MRMVRAGASLKEPADILRHQRLVIEPLTMVGDQARDFVRRANRVLRLPAM